MTTKTTELGAPVPGTPAATGATTTNAMPPKGSASAEQFAQFLATLAELGHMKRSAEAAGVTLEQVARRAREDESFAEQLKDARAARRYLVADALFEEGVLGREITDAVNGKSQRVRNVGVLTSLAKQLDELPPDKPMAQVAVQTNVNGQPTAAPSPELQAFAKKNTERMHALLKRERRADAITVDAEIVDPDNDII